MDEVGINQELLQKIVYSIGRAVEHDLPEYLQEHRKEANNATVQLRGDFINDNLRRNLVDEEIQLIPFKRFVWEGRIIVDNVNKVTYTVTTKRNLDSIPKKQRKSPHYLETILHVENGGLEAPVKQLQLLRYPAFDDDVYDDDYSSMFSGYIQDPQQFRHYVITYEAQNNELRDVQLHFLDKDFDPIGDAMPLNQYRKLDYGLLTQTDNSELDPTDKEIPDVVGSPETIKAALRTRRTDHARKVK